MTVRGLNVSSINASDSVGNGTGGTVATYLGDIPLFVDLKMIDIERVEALLGPQGTLYGAGTLGGAIRYLPNRPGSGTRSRPNAAVAAYSVDQSDGMGTRPGGMFNVPLVAGPARAAIRRRLLRRPGLHRLRLRGARAGHLEPAMPRFDGPGDDVSANLRAMKDADTEETFTGRVGLFWQVTDALRPISPTTTRTRKSAAAPSTMTRRFGTGRYVSGHAASSNPTRRPTTCSRWN